ncbi:PPE domain-containing protein [Candidatus Mycobacterium methanotrophicum]|uniref:PPE family protein n=2 Tax=Candidatus Mycobacterium methanotrophicum TaxID=2943498 RepID=A0ABY4QL18_9MYCO|nr:PPE domain-containing protein [Candidatus Mycobacterium methanotrophicum]UQX11727.1 PPE family protein [Candidatus Mycobacterium methanotrophicum]
MFPPEANYYSMVTGAGPAPTLAAAEVLVAHHAAMTATAGTSSALGAATAEAYKGAGGTASEAALVAHNHEHLVFAEETLARAQILHMAAAAHPSTVGQMVPAPPAHANRLEEATDEAINPMVWGALTPRIADLNLEYFGFMWPNNAAAGVRYGAVLEGLGAALMTPSLPAVSGGSIAAVAVAAATVAEGAALSGMQAGVGMVSSGVSAVAGPAAALPAAAMSAVSSSGSSVASAPAGSAPVQPLAGVTHIAPPAPAQTLAPAQSSSGMFAPAPNVNLMTPPPVPPTTAPSTAQPMMPRPPVTPPMPAAAPGVTSFVPPAEPFSPPPQPPAGRASGLKPGMLNAAALRGPVSTMPLTATATSTLATAQPLAYVHPEPPQPTCRPPRHSSRR